jgi:adenylate cyclase
VDVRRLNKELGARYVLEGSVQRAESTLRVTAQLLNAKDGTHLWAETYDRELSASGIFAVQDEITEQVVGTIASSLGVISRARFAEIREKPTDRLESYECVLQAEAYYRDNMVPSEHARVRDALEHAVQADPGYADAWAYLCFVYLDEHRFNFNPQPGPVDRALEAARRAVAADPTSQLAHCMLAHAHFYRKDLGAFEAETERALALNPNDATVLAALGHMLLYAGEEQGITFLRKAVVLDPFHPAWFHLPIALYHFDRREYEEALAAAKKIAIPGFYWAQVYLAAIYAESDRQREARSAFEELIRLFPGFTTATLSEELRKHNVSEERIGRWASALRKAGLPD